MNVPRMNADQARGFQLACDAMALEGRLLQGIITADPPDCTKVSPRQAARMTGMLMCDFARQLSETAAEQETP